MRFILILIFVFGTANGAFSQSYERVQRPSDPRIDYLRSRLINNYDGVREIEIQVLADRAIEQYAQSFVVELGGRWTNKRSSPFLLEVTAYENKRTDSERFNENHYRMRLTDTSGGIMLAEAYTIVRCRKEENWHRTCAFNPITARSMLAELGKPEF